MFLKILYENKCELELKLENLYFSYRNQKSHYFVLDAM